MDGLSRSSSARSIRGRLARAALVAGIGAGGLLAAPGTASAAPPINPLIDCYVQNTDGSYTVLVGYSNSGGTRSIPLGASNQMYPSRLQGTQPTTFKAGTQHGVFTMRVTAAEVNGGARWVLENRVLNYADAGAASSSCPSATELPEDGNGTGPAIALVAAGVIGAVTVQRVRRRALAAAGERRDDA